MGVGGTLSAIGFKAFFNGIFTQKYFYIDKNSTSSEIVKVYEICGLGCTMKKMYF